MSRERNLTRYVAPGIAVLAVIQIATAAWIFLAPHGFAHALAPFGAYNRHDLWDAAAFTGGLGLALAASLVWPALQAGALAAAAGMTGLHAVNHWIDVSHARAGSHAGIGDAVSLTVNLAFVLLIAYAAARSAGARGSGAAAG